MLALRKQFFLFFHKMQILHLDWVAAKPASMGKACRGHFLNGRTTVGRLGLDHLLADCTGASTHESS